MSEPRSSEVGDADHDAELRFTTHGVAHVRSGTWRGLGYGQGWACARDHLPTIADQILKVRSERAAFHGPGHADAHVASDLGYLALGVAEGAAALRDAQPGWVRELVGGYVAGYNRRVEEVHDEGSLPRWCAGAPWIRPIDEPDLYAYLADVALMGSGRNLAQLIGWARAPGPDGPHPAPGADALGGVGGAGGAGAAGASNGWALGGDVTASRGGIVLANPHFPWAGEARFWECHLTVPGELDAYGVALLGVPGIQMGFNEHLGWAHTFSRGHRFCMYQLRLEPGAPTVYRYGDGAREMAVTEHTVGVLDDDGTVRPRTEQLWRTHHGPMVNLPLLGWGLETAFSYRDANADNTAVLEQFLSMARARDVGELRQVFHTLRAMPWVNTLAADAAGDVWYSDGSATPSLSPDATERFLRRLDEDLVAALAFDNRIAMLDGSDPDDEWVEHPGARSPGLEPPERLPELSGRDLAVNANDSHWLSHPHRTLEGHPVLCGLERTPRSLRTRQNLLVAERLAERGAVTLDDVVDAVFDNHSLSGELLRDAVVARCRDAGSVELRGVTVDLWEAADVLDGWDLRADLDSVGVVLWREFMAGFAEADWRSGGALFEVPFDPADPIGTPRGLAPPPGHGPDPVLAAVAEAVLDLADAGVRIDAPLGEVQWARRGDRRIPVHGGGEAEGMINVLAPTGALASASLEPVAPDPPRVAGRDRTGLGTGGYQVTYGTSFLMAAEFTPDGPRAVGLLAYGQSGDDRSRHHVDGTEAYAAKQPRPLLFRDDDIDADPELVRMHLVAPAWTHDGIVP